MRAEQQRSGQHPAHGPGGTGHQCAPPAPPAPPAAPRACSPRHGRPAATHSAACAQCRRRGCTAAASAGEGAQGRGHARGGEARGWIPCPVSPAEGGGVCRRTRGRGVRGPAHPGRPLRCRTGAPFPLFFTFPPKNSSSLKRNPHRCKLPGLAPGSSQRIFHSDKTQDSPQPHPLWAALGVPNIAPRLLYAPPPHLPLCKIPSSSASPDLGGAPGETSREHE